MLLTENGNGSVDSIKGLLYLHGIRTIGEEFVHPIPTTKTYFGRRYITVLNSLNSHLDYCILINKYIYDA